jgi:murein lipoprotein
MRRIVGLTAALLALAVSGCATRGDLDALGARVAQLEAQAQADANRIGALEASLQDVASAADRSVARASEAEARARSAASRADDAARKADAMFKKSVSK